MADHPKRQSSISFEEARLLAEVSAGGDLRDEVSEHSWGWKFTVDETLFGSAPVLVARDGRVDCLGTSEGDEEIARFARNEPRD